MPSKPKSRQGLKRRQSSVAPKQRILIVCEGTKTEPLYFNDAKRVLRISPGLAKIEVESGSGSHPQNIVETAKKLADKAKKSAEPFDVVYCVMDRDEHANFDNALAQADKFGFKTIQSWPCFEYWVLLHFKEHSAPYARTGANSPAANCLKDLTAQWPDYNKSRDKLFHELSEKLGDAMQRSELRLKQALNEGNRNPSTDIHTLVAVLESINTPRPA